MTRRTSGGRKRRLEACGLLCLLVMLALLVPPTPVAGQEDSTNGQEILYLTERPFEANRDRWNFTVFPADENETGRDRQASQSAFPTFRASWRWFVPVNVENWSLSSGAHWDFHLFISGMDEVQPAPTVSSLSSGTVGHQIEISIERDGEMVGTGRAGVSVLDVEEGIHPYVVPVEFEGPQEFSTDDDTRTLGITISVSGRGPDPESPLRLHFGSPEHSSHVLARTYPMDALRELELDYLLKEECQRLLLQQKSCSDLQRTRFEDDGKGIDDENAPGPDDDGQENGSSTPEPEGERERGNVPGTTGIFTLIGLAFLTHRARARRHKRTPCDGTPHLNGPGGLPHWSR